jgi:hypothetical protein
MSSLAEARRKALVAAALAVVVLGALVAIGGWERARAAHEETAGMRRIARLVGPLESPPLSGYRVLPGINCLTYRRGRNPFALELCFDPEGRLVEAIDRRTTTRHIFSLRADPARSTIRVDRAAIDRLLHKMEQQ